MEIEEQLSALADGELGAAESATLIERLKRDPELRARWARYHLIGEAIRHDLPPRVSTDLLQHRRGRHAPVTSRRAVRWRQWGGLALAASVVLAVALVWSPRRAPEPSAPAPVAQVEPPVETAPPPPVAAAAPQRVLPQRVVRPRTGLRWEQARPEVAWRLNGYLVNHNEYAPSSAMRGGMPYVRIVAYDAR